MIRHYATMIMPLWGWLLSLGLFGILMLAGRIFRPSWIWREIFWPVREIQTEQGFNDPKATVVVTYERDGHVETATLTVEEFKKIVVTDSTGSGHLFRGRSVDWTIGGVWCGVGAIVAVVVGYWFSK